MYRGWNLVKISVSAAMSFVWGVASGPRAGVPLPAWLPTSCLTRSKSWNTENVTRLFACLLCCMITKLAT